MDHLEQAKEETKVGGRADLAVAHALIDMAQSLRIIANDQKSIATTLLSSSI